LKDSLLPEGVRQFLRANIDSLDALEVLLLLFGQPARQWTAEEVGRECRTNEWAAGMQLRTLSTRGLVRAVDATPMGYQADDAHAAAVEALARTYRERRVGVITFIYSPAASG
jgi:hypothetical protein